MSIIYDALKKIEKSVNPVRNTMDAKQNSKISNGVNPVRNTMDAKQNSKISNGVNPVRNTTQVSANTTVSNRINKNPILLYILIISFGLFAGNIAFNTLIRPKIKLVSYPNPTVITQTKKEPPAPLANLPQEEKPISPVRNTTQINTNTTVSNRVISDPSLILNGVFFQKDKGYALINNRILYTGDKIEGATIKEINLEKVDLEFEGRIITLINSSR
ncbi:MAG: hypothetical protein COX41_00730 [Candidatus Omnitrophica bacterium CG23_combo_of_CG06-09_8_20_14_all_41_10]|uniref:Uncharacterized protein n=1 Tax=Candidatus Sherwoodlollariibacterium unditelluris TaxID=1974757 RepID=A0A2G9YKQ7_9BACT|nr:MAG: hypothetical protein COX41_00730 [Candidatus Omnitrophica bacterium CG23_combo_of_CG06-09_8_20_14_all_41_10]